MFVVHETAFEQTTRLVLWTNEKLPALVSLISNCLDLFSKTARKFCPEGSGKCFEYKWTHNWNNQTADILISVAAWKIICLGFMALSRLACLWTFKLSQNFWSTKFSIQSSCFLIICCMVITSTWLISFFLLFKKNVHMLPFLLTSKVAIWVGSFLQRLSNESIQSN